MLEHRVTLITLALLGGCHSDDWLTYGWDDRRVLCSSSVDDLVSDVDWGEVEETLAYAERENVVALFHAHVPRVTISIRAIESLLVVAQAHHLDFIRYDELRPDQPRRAGLALVFDDQATQAWTDIRPLLANYGARVTFEVTRYPNYTDEMKAQIRQLADDGHDIEAHSISHLHTAAYIAEHGLDAYLTEEVMPSFQVLRDDHYTPTTYAFPFGAADVATYEAVLAQPGVERVRLSPGSCPY